MKKNQCGTKFFSSTRNLLIAVMGEQSIPYGIPDYNHERLYSIIETAIKDQKILEILYTCFGLKGRERKLQKEVAGMVGLPESQISILISECLGKLRQSPYKAKIRSLMVSEEELFDKASRTESAERQLETLQAEIAKLKAENTRITEQNEILSKECAGSWSQVKAAKAELHKKEIAVKVAEARAEAAYKAYDDLAVTIKEAADATSKEMTARVAEAMAELYTLEDLDLEKEIIAALKRARITDVKMLCKMTKSGLHRLGVRTDYVGKIQIALEEKGLSLKVA